MNQDLLLFLTNAGTAILAWFLGKRKTNAETDNIVLKNLEESLNLYKLIIDNLRSEITTLHNKIDEMEQKIDKLTEENINLKKQLNSTDFIKPRK